MEAVHRRLPPRPELLSHPFQHVGPLHLWPATGAAGGQSGLRRALPQLGGCRRRRRLLPWWPFRRTGREHRVQSSGFSASGCGTPFGPAPHRSGAPSSPSCWCCSGSTRYSASPSQNISWQGHLGGLLAGVLIGALWSSPTVARDPARRVGVAAAVGVITVLLVTLSADASRFRALAPGQLSRLRCESQACSSERG